MSFSQTLFGFVGQLPNNFGKFLLGITLTFTLKMTDHTLEKSWWLDDPPQVDHLPPSSLMSFTKCGIGREQSRDTIVEQDIPKFCIIQIGCSQLYLNAKWLPLLMLTQLIQASALDTSIKASQARKKKTATNVLRLVWFYDSLLQKFAEDATAELTRSGKDALPDDWMPDSMHRYLTRMELNIPHTPTALEENYHMLNEAYENQCSHFSFGV
jgi:hypothetical protein